MRYSLIYISDSYVDIKTLHDNCVLIPSSFKYEKYYPTGERENTYQRVIKIKFIFLFWRFEIMLRK